MLSCHWVLVGLFMWDIVADQTPAVKGWTDFGWFALFTDSSPGTAAKKTYRIIVAVSKALTWVINVIFTVLSEEELELWYATA